ncbi:hypothetical protein R3P38DRAFT_824862 [Favolaschia claudopus]|uniref:Ribosomal protein L14 n=1 Tax=Favolaschia claudopus TaxID=2862362 RepID=A0AAW0BXW3_9AGAR
MRGAARGIIGMIMRRTMSRGGRFYLCDVVERAGNSQYLSLVKRLRISAHFVPALGITLPSLDTLCVQSISSNVWKQVDAWSFPRLRVLKNDTQFISFTRASNRL